MPSSPTCETAHSEGDRQHCASPRFPTLTFRALTLTLVTLSWLHSRALRGLWRIASTIVPARYQIPLRFRIHMWEDCEPELKHLPAIGPNRGVAIDVGANLGLYAYHMSLWYDEVYAFEANEELTDLLRAYESDAIHVISKGISSKTGFATLHIPVIRGVPHTGWATLDPETYPTVQTFIRKDVEVCRLDDFNLRNVGLIKIDVEGHELQVLRGAEAMISRDRPHVIAEIKPRQLNAIWRFFAERGYNMTLARDMLNTPSKGNNYIFVPKS